MGLCQPDPCRGNLPHVQKGKGFLAALALSHMKTLKGLWEITVLLEDALHKIMVQRPLMKIRIRQSLLGPTAPSSKEKTGDVEPLRRRNRAWGRES